MKWMSKMDFYYLGLATFDYDILRHFVLATPDGSEETFR